MDSGLKNRTVVVTGASGGIGYEIASTFAAEGANVVVHFHGNEQRASALVERLGAAHAIALQADLTEETSVQQLFHGAVQRFGSIDHLVCNAGVWPPEHVPIVDMTVEQWKRTLAIDITSVFLCCRAFMGLIRQAKTIEPSIVLIGSTAGIFGEAGHGDYASAKSGLIGGLMYTLKNEIVNLTAQGRVNSVSPGWVVTPMTKKFADDGIAIKQALATIAMGKVGTPQDIANAVVFLSSPKLAGHITGQNLVVSGGMEGRLLHDPA